MSNPTRSFAFYPPAVAAEKFDYDFKEDKNPALRGLPMVLAASLYVPSEPWHMLTART
jgi:hypothetical protein